MEGEQEWRSVACEHGHEFENFAGEPLHPAQKMLSSPHSSRGESSVARGFESRLDAISGLDLLLFLFSVPRGFFSCILFSFSSYVTNSIQRFGCCGSVLALTLKHF